MAMAIPGTQQLTEAELDRLGKFLETCNGGEAMNLEELDGFFTALVAGPRVVMPSEYLPLVWGRPGDEPVFEDIEEANEILGLMMRQWNTIATTLAKGEAHMPVLLEEEDGVVHGNDWAHGFIRGTLLDHEAWLEMMEEEKRFGWFLPILVLHHEDDEDPKMRPRPLTPDRRESAIAMMAGGALNAYRHFRETGAPERTAKPQRARVVIGRNDPCPCGSGKKYKRCCGCAPVQ